MTKNQKKKHHYIPVAYLNSFADGDGRVWVYFKDDPNNPKRISPNSIGFERYYYSQPLPDGGQDNNLLETFFSKIETDWTPIIECLRAGQQLPLAKLGQFYQFLTLMRVRVPAARDAVELMMSNHAKQTTKMLVRAGKLPPPPDGMPDLLDFVEWAVDPHQSIHAMIEMMEGFGQVLGRVGLEIVKNSSEVDFCTSDNPVIYFDPDQPEDQMRPYSLGPLIGRIELLMPVSPKILIRGRSELRFLNGRPALPYSSMTSATDVRRVNRLVARFGYRAIFANGDGLQPLVKRHAALSPTVKCSNIDSPMGEYQICTSVFGPRPVKPRWVPDGRLDPED